MEFYKEYFDRKLKGYIGNYPEYPTYVSVSAIEWLNREIDENPQWASKVVGYAHSQEGARILVRWVGLSETPFKESEE